jgi:hypothetical protein
MELFYLLHFLCLYCDKRFSVSFLIHLFNYYFTRSFILFYFTVFTFYSLVLLLASSYLSPIYVPQGLQHLLEFSHIKLLMKLGVDIFTDERSKTLSLIRHFSFISVRLKENFNEIRIRGSGANNNVRHLDGKVLATLTSLR